MFAPNFPQYPQYYLSKQGITIFVDCTDHAETQLDHEFKGLSEVLQENCFRSELRFTYTP